jgi:uncharacterized tellurite resistance protein B-like protein
MDDRDEEIGEDTINTSLNRESKPEELTQDRFGNQVDQSTMASVAALLCLMDQMEPSIEHREFQEIIQLLAREFMLSDQQAGHLTEVVSFMLRDKLKVESFIQRLNKDFSALQRSRILNLVWDVAMADGIVTQKEKQLYGFLREHLRLDMLGRSEERTPSEEFDDESE